MTERKYLLPDQAYFGDGDEVVATVLGSCVSVTFHHPGSGFGAIFHGRLPNAPDNAVPCAESHYRFVDCAIHRILGRLDRMGMARQELEIGVFGGGAVIRADLPATMYVGRRNVETALATLAKAGLRIHHREVGGHTGRKLEFTPATGQVKIRHITMHP